MKAIINARLIIPDDNGDFSVMKGGAILFEEKISAIMPTEKFSAETSRDNIGNVNGIEEIFDAKGKFVSPGFINIHVHGGWGADVMDEDNAAINTVAKLQAKTGVTSFLPTTMTYDMPRVRRALDRARASMKNGTEGAKVLGAHMEGPFVNEKYRGAQAVKDIIPANFSLIEDFADAIKIITFAPETLPPDQSDDFIKKCRRTGIVVSIGHTAATYDETTRALAAGATSFTHLFNAMTGLHHRKGGAVLAALDSSAYAELIADNVHVAPPIERLVAKLKKNRLVAITDSMRAAGMGDGESELGGQKVFVKGTLATLADGTIAGSVLTLDRGVYNLCHNTGRPAEEIIETATKNPAELLGVYDKIGSLSPGKAADILIFDDDINIAEVFVGGRRFF